jgi:phenylacetic acid degradation protein paaN
MSLYEKHQSFINKALEAIHNRTFYAAFPEHPKAYGEDGFTQGKILFEALCGKKFERLSAKGISSWHGEEVSPYTQDSLNIQYPIYDFDVTINNAKQALRLWKKITPQERAGILVETLERIKTHFFEIAYATMHTTGQSFMMSFQASGPHSLDRALEPVALGLHELTRFPNEVVWEKPMGKFSVKLEKNFAAVPKGISLVIGCSTFPVWNTLPGVFASLITGNPVIIKPHPKAVLPIAICVADIQDVLRENDIDETLVQLACDSSELPITKKYCEHSDVKLIDYTGNSTFGNYIEQLQVQGKTVFTEKAGVNSVILDSVKNIDEVTSNLAFALSLYSGQMCTAPQNIFIPESGVKADDKTYSYEEVVEKLKAQLSGISNNPKMGVGVLGAIQNENTLKRVEKIADLKAQMALTSSAIRSEEFPKTRTVSPTLLEVKADDHHIYSTELFGPIAICIKTKNTDESLQLARSLAAQHGAITCAAYSTDIGTLNKIGETMQEVFVPVTFNLTGPIWVNQHAAFSDFHVTGGNAAGNASFTNPEFVQKRFVWVGHRKMV